MEGYEINTLDLVIAALIMLLPISVLAYYRTGLIKDTLIAYGRMVLQLSLVGLYLEFIFDINSLWLNIAWVAVMIIAAAMAITGRAGIKYRYLAPALGLSILVNVVVNGLIYIFLIVGWPDFLDARYIIPIMGMVIGNTLGATVIGIRSFFNGLSKDSNVYQYYLMCGATKGEALFRFMSKAMQDAFSPNIASTATIGLIWLPGMMTGQILGGASPVTAIKYQIMIIISIFVGGVITVWLSLLISKRFVFDDYDLFDQGIFRGQKAKKAHTAKS